MLPELTRADSGMLLADRAYLSKPLKQQLLEQQGLELSIPTKYGEPTHLNRKELVKRKRLRRSIETVGSQLCHDLHIKKFGLVMFGICSIVYVVRFWLIQFV